jgi:AcrR family transcriptional regulator
VISKESRRAAPLAPDERRRAIVAAVVPLLLDSGADVTTRQIAEAAGIAEGTIFRVFPDKAALLMAAAEEIMSPAQGGAELRAALQGCDDLRTRLLVTTERMFARSDQVMVVMMALRRFAMTDPDHARHRPGPPPFLAEANRALHALLTEVFEPHRDELSVDPATAATLLRTLVLGSRHPGVDPATRLSAEQVVDVLLDGIRCHEKGD